MRHWLLHPIIFYPLALLFAAFVIAVSLKPQSWPRPPAAVAAERVEGALVFRRAAFNSPAVDNRQVQFVERDFWGNPLTWRIAQKPSEPPPQPTETGAQLLLTPADAELLNNRAVTVEVSYNPLPVNPATGLAVSLQGGSPAFWVNRAVPPETATLRFDLPAQSGVTAIGLRALSGGGDQNYGLEITRIRVTPRA